MKAKIKPKVKAKARSRGRPSKIDLINFEQVSKLYLNGFTDYQVADFLNISEATLNNWKFNNPKLLESIKDWKNPADDRVERALYQRACGYTHVSEEIFCAFGKVTRVKTVKIYPPDPLSCIMWLKNRRPEVWRDKPPEAPDDRFQDATLTFIGVPNQKDPKLEREFSQYYDQN